MILQEKSVGSAAGRIYGVMILDSSMPTMIKVTMWLAVRFVSAIQEGTDEKAT